MATLTKSTGTVTLSGAVEKVTFPAVYGWVWVKNMSDSDMFLGLDDGVSAGADGVMRIPAGDAGRIQTDGQDSVYLIGTGNALVVAQNYSDCPFKIGGKGGGIPDLSAYAKKTDVPSIKVNSAGNADTVNGHSVNADVPENAVFTDTVPDLSAYAKKTDIPTELPANGGISHEVRSPNGKALLYEDGEGGNFELTSPDGSHFMQMDLFSNTDFRMYFGNRTTGEMAFPFYYKFDTGKIELNGTSDIYTVLNKPYVTGTIGGWTVSSSGIAAFDYTGVGFKPTAVICVFNNGVAQFAKPIDDGFQITLYSTSGTSLTYLAFK